MNTREMFLRHVGQTSDSPLAINMVKAEGSWLWDIDGKKYIDLIAGISVCNIGHRHPRVLAAIQEQAEKYLHIMVYGELVENPQVAYAIRLTSLLPSTLNTVFFTASGSEATEGAMKLAKRYTGRSKIISFKRSYHGSTQGSLSIMGDEYWRNAFRPLLPGIIQLDYNDFDQLDAINEEVSCVIMETIQAEAGVNIPHENWIKTVREKCTANGVLMVCDEIQCGFGRNGTLWAFEQFGIVPDVLLLGKALGAGLPLGAFIANNNIMRSLAHDPVLGHINTFGGHPLSCAAGLAGLEALIEERMIEGVKEKEERFVRGLKHPLIKKVSSRGLMMAVHFQDAETNQEVIAKLLEEGIFTDWFLFAPQALRIVPPLNISDEDIDEACMAINNCCKMVSAGKW